jgi:hypothetical protein
MKTTASILALAVAVRGHYTFDKLQVNGEVVGDGWQYIREHTRGYMPTKGQQILEDDFRCQPGGASGANTDVYTVGTGDKVSFLGAFGMNSIEHPGMLCLPTITLYSFSNPQTGPAQVYMSKSDDVKADDGSGDWFKVRDALFCENPGNDGALTTSWCTWGEPGIEFVVPDTIPDGEYLVRVEHIPLHGAQGTSTGAEYYYSCGQLKVEGSTVDAMPAFDTIKIPGGVQPDDDGVTFNIWTQVSEYPFTVGPALIPGGTTWGTADGSSDAVITQGGSAAPAESSNTSTSSAPADTQANESTAAKDCDVQYIERSARRSFKA